LKKRGSKTDVWTMANVLMEGPVLLCICWGTADFTQKNVKLCNFSNFWTRLCKSISRLLFSHGLLIQSPTLSILHSLFLNSLLLSSKLSSVHFLPRDCFMAPSKHTAKWASFPLGNLFFPLHLISRPFALLPLCSFTDT